MFVAKDFILAFSFATESQNYENRFSWYNHLKLLEDFIDTDALIFFMYN